MAHYVLCIRYLLTVTVYSPQRQLLQFGGGRWPIEVVSRGYMGNEWTCWLKEACQISSCRSSAAGL